MDAINERARGLADELLALLDLGDRQCAYISAMQVLIGRCGLDPQQVQYAQASVISHNLCGDEPIRLVVARPEGNAQQEPGPERPAAVGSPVSRKHGGRFWKRPGSNTARSTTCGILLQRDGLSHYDHWLFFALVSIRNRIVTGFNLYCDATCHVRSQHLPVSSNSWCAFPKAGIRQSPNWGHSRTARRPFAAS